MELKGKAHVFGDDINTDYIISGKYKFKTLDMDELGKHVMEDLDPDFSSKVEPGDFLVAGMNFGCGSSREQAPRALLASGIQIVLARSFARIFFRNAINCGLVVMECDTEGIETGDEMTADLTTGEIKNLTHAFTRQAQPLPDVMIRILQEGGLVEYIKKYGTFQEI